MKVRVIKIESEYDCGKTQQYRLEVKQGFRWKVIDRFYASNCGEAELMAKEKISKLRLNAEVCREFEI